MNIELLKSFPCKIKFDIQTNKYTQGNVPIKCSKVFRNKTCYFSNIPKKNTTSITKFIDLLMFITNDMMISREDYKKLFVNNLEKANDYLKTLTHRHRAIKFQILDIIEDKALLCDYPNCIKFYSNLIKMNIIMIVNNMYTKHDIGYTKTAVIYCDNGSFDFGINTSVDISVMKKYLSVKLLNELNVSEILEFAKLYKIDIKIKKKQDLINSLTNCIL